MYDPLLQRRQGDVTRVNLLVSPFRLTSVNIFLLVLVPLLLFQRLAVVGAPQHGIFFSQRATGGSPQAPLFALASVLLVQQLPLLPRRAQGLLPKC